MLTKTSCSKCGKEYQAASATFAARPDRLCLSCITAWAETKPCPDCGLGPITTKMTENWMQYGRGPEKTFIKSLDPLRICGACDFAYFDYAAEEIHIIATNRYLAAVGKPLYEK